MIRKALMLKIVSWLVLSPAYVMAQRSVPLQSPAGRISRPARHGMVEGLPIAPRCGISSA